MSTQKSLVEYLSTLNTKNSSWGVWVNPKNINEYRVGRCMHMDERIGDGWVFIGNLHELSFSLQSQYDTIQQYLENNIDRAIDVLLDVYSNGLLDSDFKDFLENKAQELQKTWSRKKAEDFVQNKLPEILKRERKDFV